MKIKDFVKLCNSGINPVIKMNKNICDYAEDSFDPEMIGKVVDVKIEYEDSYCLLIDMNGYEKHNKSVASYDWFDEEGIAKVTWFDTKYYPKDGVEPLYLPFDGDIPFEIINQNYLFSNYLKSGSDKTYVEFLENLVMELRDEIEEARQNY